MNQGALWTVAGLLEGRIQQRYKRFLADIELPGIGLVTAHCANTGTMKSCWEPGDTVLVAPNENPARKLKYTWMACRRGDAWVGIDTGIPNKVVAEAARRDMLPGLRGLHAVRTEVPYGRERSRIDVLATNDEGLSVYLEVKNTTLRMDTQVCFPDAVTTRGAKHLRELQAMVEEGHRAAVIFFVNRGDAAVFDAARDIDPAYARALDEAAAAGVEVLPYQPVIRAQDHVDGTCTLSWEAGRLLPWRSGHPGV